MLIRFSSAKKAVFEKNCTVTCQKQIKDKKKVYEDFIGQGHYSKVKGQIKVTI